MESVPPSGRRTVDRNAAGGKCSSSTLPESPPARHGRKSSNVPRFVPTMTLSPPPGIFESIRKMLVRSLWHKGPQLVHPLSIRDNSGQCSTNRTISSHYSYSISKPKLQPLIAISLPLPDILLVTHPFPLTHALPNLLLPLIQHHQPPPLTQHDHQRQRADGDQHFVATIVVGCVVGTVDLRADQRPDLDDDVVGRGSESALFDVERILGNPGGEDGVEVGV